MTKFSVRAVIIAAFCLAGVAQAVVQDGFDAVYRNCFAQPVSRFQTISIVAPAKYQTAWFDFIGEAADIIPIASNGVEYVIDEGRAFFAADYRGSNARGQMELMARYIRSRADRLPNDKNKEFSKSCMVLCASANYLTYKHRDATKYGGMSTLMKEKEGECTEFARFADDLAGRVGVSSLTVSNLKMGHAYVGFYIPATKKWYYAEPQSSECRFMDTTLK